MMRSISSGIWCLVVFFLTQSCQKDAEQGPLHLFTLMDGNKTGIDFVNQVENTKEFNIYTYRNFYNGGGVAIGDVNNDGLSDVFLTANMGPNKLYLNQGDFTFIDISKIAGIEGQRAWSTGVAMADVNADGFLDIYVCNSGDVEGDNRQNELFINNTDGTFTERAEEYGLADIGFSTQASFFDYDKDGDLDVYVLNNSFRAIGSFNLQRNERYTRDSLGGDKLYRNDGRLFTDVSEEAGIYGSTIAFGLGIQVTDLNRDQWPDIYVCNDFFERDYIYLNQQDGTFRETLTEQMNSISMASMGVDAADLNQDGYPELFVTEMLPKDEGRLKTSMTFENWDKYRHNIRYDYHHQFTRNMLHLNLGNMQDQPIGFSEVGRLAGVEATDWSWSALLADLDLDGYRDLYITNGVYKDILNQDYLRYISNDVVARSMLTEDGINYKKLIDIIPSQPISNFMYAGGEKLAFQDSTRAWGFEKPGFSNGAAYGDLDNDGDLDLIINNVNMPSFVYRNNTTAFYPERQYLKVTLKGEGKNPFAIGAQITAKCGEQTYYLEQVPVRGFQSSMDYQLVLGTADARQVDSLLIDWPSGKQSLLLNVPTGQLLTIKESSAADTDVALFNPTLLKEKAQPMFREITAGLPDEMRHEENAYSDFDKDPLLFQMVSTEGPKLAIGDVNNDGREDVYLCGAKNKAGKIFIQKAGGAFTPVPKTAFEEDSRCEDVDARFFDADGDGDQDLYVVSGSNEYSSSSSALADRLYINDGRGRFTKSNQLLPTTKFESTSCVEVADFDQDGDPDLFVGVRLRDRLYGIPQNGYLLENDGSGKFRNVSEAQAPELSELGMIKDACWADVNQDGQMDLIVVGEWMSIHLFINKNGQLVDKSSEWGLNELSGWWNVIKTADLDNDGDADFIVGNHGLNSRFRASEEKPVSCYINDFDQNGKVEQIICAYNGEISYPLPLLHDLTQQLPGMKKNYLKYENYQEKKIEDLFAPDQLKKSLVHEVTILESVALINEGGRFSVQSLPKQAQYAPIYAIAILDINKDGNQDVLLGGNLFEVKPEMGRYDAGYGLCLLGKGNGNFTSASIQESGLKIEGQIRDIVPFNRAGQKGILVARNNDHVQAFEISQQ